MGGTAIYKAFIKAGVDEVTATAAANDIAASGEIATKSDIATLKSGMSELEVPLIKWMVSLHLATLALTVTFIKLL